MKLGGYPTTEDAGLRLKARDALYARIQDLGEGAVFTASDIVRTADEAKDFAAMRGHDYVHVIDEYLTGIVESVYLRRLPRLSAFLDAYRAVRGCDIVETGDRVAWRRGLKEFEPIEGYRFYTSGPKEVLSFGRMKIWMLPAEEWQLDTSKPASLFRAFLDLSPKDRVAAFARRRRTINISDLDMEAAAAWARERFVNDESEENSPAAVLAEVELDLRSKEAAS